MTAPAASATTPRQAPLAESRHLPELGPVSGGGSTLEG